MLKNRVNNLDTTEMNWQHYLHHLGKARTLPPRVLLRKASIVLTRGLRLVAEEAWAHVRPQQISDSTLQRALVSGVSLVQLPSLLRSGAGTKFFIDPADRDEQIALLRKIAPQASGLIVAEADRICEHVFDLLGSGPTPLGEQIDWHVDFKTGHRWDPKTYGKRINLAPYIGGYDIKVPWELSRCQHFTRLGQAYWITGDEKYAREFVAQVEGWIESNRWPFGVNWACTMDVAIRAVNWLWGLAFFADSPSLTDEFLLRCGKSLLVHGRHIIHNLEKTDDFANNHYLSDLVGLIYLGILCPQFKEAQKWRDVGLNELWKEMSKQVYPDGVSFEASISYHRLALELLLSPIILCQLNSIPVSDAVMIRLEKMFEFVLCYTKPDGTVPLIGDCDNGRLHRLSTWADPDREWIDHRYLLAIGAVLFERDDFAQAAGDQWEEASWLLGERARMFKEKFDRNAFPPLRLESRAFSDAGLYIMRHDDVYMIVDAGSNGQNGNGGHAHNDVLSFELHVGNQVLVVDPGTYVYTADPPMRNLFRSTSYHNAVMVDGEEQNRVNPYYLFRMSNDAVPKVNHWKSSPGYDLLDAEHWGYRRLSQPVTHRRTIYFDKSRRFWFVKDVFLGEGDHRFDFFFHVTSASIRIDNGDRALTLIEIDHEQELALRIVIFCSDANVRVEESWVSRAYGTKTRSSVIHCSKRCHTPCEFTTVLYPATKGRASQETTSEMLETCVQFFQEQVSDHVPHDAGETGALKCAL